MKQFVHNLDQNCKILYSQLLQNVPINFIYQSKEMALMHLRDHVVVYTVKSIINRLPFVPYGELQKFAATEGLAMLKADKFTYEGIKHDELGFGYLRRFFESYVAVYGYDDDIRGLCAPDHLEAYINEL